MIDIDTNVKDILNYAVENGIIDLAHIQKQADMKKRDIILKQHQYEIWQDSEKRWCTYLPDETKGRIRKKRVSYEELLDVIVEFYNAQSKKNKPVSFLDCYKTWRSVHDLELCDNSIIRYDNDYKRFFDNSDFSLKPIKEINSEVIKAFIITTIKEQKLCKKACKTLFGYIKNTIYSARVNKIIADNPMEFLQAKDFYKFCTTKERTKEKTIISDDRWKLINKQIEKDKIVNPSYLPVYAVQFAMLTGFRVGEISALRWDSIKDDYILVDKSEKYNRKTHTYYIDSTKNKKSRIYPLTTEIKVLLKEIKRVSIQNNILSEWVFSDKNGRINAPVISSCIKNKCTQLGIEPVSIHACRRTVNSKLRCGGVSATVAASLLGHTEQVNEQYYTFDVASLKEKQNIIEAVNRQVVNL